MFACYKVHYVVYNLCNLDLFVFYVLQVGGEIKSDNNIGRVQLSEIYVIQSKVSMVLLIWLVMTCFQQA